MPKSVSVAFYVDEDILGLAHVLAALRTDVTYPGDPGATIRNRTRPPCPIERGTKDDVWVPKVTAFKWLIISRDHNIRENPLERAAVRDSGARMVALSGEHAGDKWVQLELVMRHWRKIERLTSQPGPFIYLATYARRQPLDLTDRPRPKMSRGRGPTRRPMQARSPDEGLW